MALATTDYERVDRRPPPPFATAPGVPPAPPDVPHPARGSRTNQLLHVLGFGRPSTNLVVQLKKDARSLNTRFMTTCLIPMLVVGYIGYQRTSDGFDKHARELLQSNAEHTAASLSQRIVAGQLQVRNTARLMSATTAPYAATAALDSAMRSTPIFDLLVETDRSGHIVAASTVQPDGRPLDTSSLRGRAVGAESWFSKTVAAGPAAPVSLDDVHDDALTSEIYRQPRREVIISAPVLDSSGQVSGVVSAWVSFERAVVRPATDARRVLQGLKITGANLRVVDRNGRILFDANTAGPIADTRVAGDRALSSLVNAASGTAGSTTSTENGREVVAGYAKTDAQTSLGWGVETSQPSAEIQRDPQNFRNLILLFVVICVVCTAGGSYFFVRRLRSQADDVARVFAMTQSSPIAMFYAGTDLEIRFQNAATYTLFEKLAVTLELASTELVGSHLDRLHAWFAAEAPHFLDASSLPRSTELILGDEVVSVQVAALLNERGAFLGPMVSATLVTERVASERRAEAAREAQLQHEKELAEARAAQELAVMEAERERVAVAHERERAVTEHQLEEARAIQQRADRLLQAVTAAAHGDLSIEIEVDGDDAIGQIAVGLRRLFSVLRSSVSQIRDHAGTLSMASDDLRHTAAQMEATATMTSGEAASLADGSRRVSASVTMVAAAAEEMTASINEIAVNATDAADVVAEAVSLAEAADRTIAKLGLSSRQVGDVIGVIVDIASQTNLLALNATIEAARAGDAGRGFAIVAQNVKELAAQTTQASEEIQQAVDSMKVDTGAAVDSINRISEIISQVNEIAITIAAAVEQQAATTAEIARSANDAARDTAGIDGGIGTVTAAAESTSHGIASTVESAAELALLAQELRDLVDLYRTEMA